MELPFLLIQKVDPDDGTVIASIPTPGDPQMSYPYGLAGSPYRSEVLEQAFTKELIVLLGRDDKPSQGGFRESEEAMAQGNTRPKRGEYSYTTAKEVTEAKAIALNWKLKYVEGVDHNYRKMSLAAIPLIIELSRK